MDHSAKPRCGMLGLEMNQAVIRRLCQEDSALFFCYPKGRINSSGVALILELAVIVEREPEHLFDNQLADRHRG